MATTTTIEELRSQRFDAWVSYHEHRARYVEGDESPERLAAVQREALRIAAIDSQIADLERRAA